MHKSHAALCRGFCDSTWLCVPAPLPGARWRARAQHAPAAVRDVGGVRSAPLAAPLKGAAGARAPPGGVPPAAALASLATRARDPGTQGRPGPSQDTSGAAAASLKSSGRQRACLLTCVESCTEGPAGDQLALVACVRVRARGLAWAEVGPWAGAGALGSEGRVLRVDACSRSGDRGGAHPRLAYSAHAAPAPAAGRGGTRGRARRRGTGGRRLRVGRASAGA